MAEEKLNEFGEKQNSVETEHVKCSGCGANMEFLGPGAVKIVDGRADMSDTVARFRCNECDSLYRRIATTNYFQWSEK